MPKTRNAFALERLYGESLISEYGIFNYENRPDYDDAAYYNEYFGSTEWQSEEGILGYLDNYSSSFPKKETCPDFEYIKIRMAVEKSRFLKYRIAVARIERHIVSLQKYSQRIFDKILANGLEQEFQDRGNRVKELIAYYEEIFQTLLEYEKVLRKDRAECDRTFQRECRKEFGRRLRHARLEKGISIDDMSRKLGMSRTGYSYYELGKRDLPTPTIYSLAKILQVSLDWLFGLKE